MAHLGIGCPKLRPGAVSGTSRGTRPGGRRVMGAVYAAAAVLDTAYAAAAALFGAA